MSVFLYPTYLLLTDSIISNKQDWINWLANECPIHRFGGDFPVDYYIKLEKFWLEECNRWRDPIYCRILDHVGLEITDGHHRYAISLKNDILFVPITIVTD